MRLLRLPAEPTALSDYLGDQRTALRYAEIEKRWGRGSLRAAMREGTVVRTLPGVYCAASAANDPIVRACSAVAWPPTSVVTGEMALHLYTSALPAPSTVDLVVPQTLHQRGTAQIALRRTGPLRVTSSALAVPCATPERALLDAWRYAPAAARQELLWQSLWERVCTWRQLTREVERATRIPDRLVLSRMLGRFADGATSPLEVRAKYETFADPRFREFEWQVALRAGGRRLTADMLHRRAKLVVELDGERYHANSGAEDRERDIDLAAAGYLTVRLTWADVSRRPQWCRDRVLAVVRARLGATSAPRGA